MLDCKYYEVLSKVEVLPDGSKSKVPYADLCKRKGEGKEELCPNCLECDLMHQAADEFLENTVHPR